MNVPSFTLIVFTIFLGILHNPIHICGDKNLPKNNGSLISSTDTTPSMAEIPHSVSGNNRTMRMVMSLQDLRKTMKENPDNLFHHNENEFNDDDMSLESRFAHPSEDQKLKKTVKLNFDDGLHFLNKTKGTHEKFSHEMKWGSPCNVTNFLLPDNCERVPEPQAHRMECYEYKCVCKFAKYGSEFSRMRYDKNLDICVSPERGRCNLKFSDNLQCEQLDENGTELSDKEKLWCGVPKPRRFKRYRKNAQYCLKEEDILKQAQHHG